MTDLSRRTIIKGTGAIGAAMLPATAKIARADSANSHGSGSPTNAPSGGAGASHEAPSTTYLFFNTEEAAFVEAAVARLIPKDDQWAGALEAGAPNYIDKQLAGAWVAGERLYRSGPWQPGTPTQGVSASFHAGRTVPQRNRCDQQGVGTAPICQDESYEQDDYLKSLEAGGKDLGGVPSEVFFAHLRQCTLEGFFSDPVYGGNRDMVSWRMIGFPGAYASYYDLVDQHGIKINRQPMSLAQDAHGHIHMNPSIPARSP
jgi:gluconate 2-dehydrogenase gamma chain